MEPFSDSVCDIHGVGFRAKRGPERIRHLLYPRQVLRYCYPAMARCNFIHGPIAVRHCVHLCNTISRLLRNFVGQAHYS